MLVGGQNPEAELRLLAREVFPGSREEQFTTVAVTSLFFSLLSLLLFGILTIVFSWFVGGASVERSKKCTEAVEVRIPWRENDK